MTKPVLLAQEIFQVGLVVFYFNKGMVRPNTNQKERMTMNIKLLHSSFLGRTQHSTQGCSGEALGSVTGQREREEMWASAFIVVPSRRRRQGRREEVPGL